MRLTDRIEFDCVLISICDPINFIFYIAPLIPEIQKLFTILLDHLRDIPHAFLDSFKSISNSIGKPCLVQSGKSWLRGEIVEKVEASFVRVYLVDAGISDVFDFSCLRKMDSQSLKFPRKIVKAKLNVEKSETGLQQLINEFGGKKLRATIKSYDANEIPVIDLMDQDGNLIV